MHAKAKSGPGSELEQAVQKGWAELVQPLTSSPFERGLYVPTRMLSAPHSPWLEP